MDTAREYLVFLYANSIATDQPAYSRRLTSVFIIRSLKVYLSIYIVSNKSMQLSMRDSAFSDSKAANPMFSRRG